MGAKHDVLTEEELAVHRINPGIIDASGFIVNYSVLSGKGFCLLKMFQDFLVRNGFPVKNIRLLLCKSGSRL